MPIKIQKLSNGKYKVYNAITGQIHSKGTTKQNATRQKRLLDYIDSKRK
jgi:regulator of sigma D